MLGVAVSPYRWFKESLSGAGPGGVFGADLTGTAAEGTAGRGGREGRAV